MPPLLHLPLLMGEDIMKEYYGTKQIFAEPQEKDGKAGYKVQYPPDGYESWSPKEAFEAAYQPVTELSFGHACIALWTGRAAGAVRSVWAGANLTIKLQVPDEHSKMTEPYLYIEHSAGARFPWTPSNPDIFSEDWQLVDESGAIIDAGATDAFNEHRANNPVESESVGPEADQPATGTDVPVNSEEVTVGESQAGSEGQPSESQGTTTESNTETGDQSAPTATSQSDTTPSPEEQQEGTPAQQTAETELEHNTAEADQGNDSQSTAPDAGQGDATDAAASADTNSTTPSELTEEQLKAVVRDILQQDADLKPKIKEAVKKYGPRLEEVMESDYGSLYNDLIAIKDEATAPVNTGDAYVDFDFTQTDKDDTGN